MKFPPASLRLRSLSDYYLAFYYEYRGQRSVRPTPWRCLGVQEVTNVMVNGIFKAGQGRGC